MWWCKVGGGTDLDVQELRSLFSVSFALTLEEVASGFVCDPLTPNPHPPSPTPHPSSPPHHSPPTHTLTCCMGMGLLEVVLPSVKITVSEDSPMDLVCVCGGGRGGEGNVGEGRGEMKGREGKVSH